MKIMYIDEMAPIPYRDGTISCFQASTTLDEKAKMLELLAATLTHRIREHFSKNINK